MPIIFIFLLVLSTSIIKAHAIVVAPIIAITVLKITVIVISALSAPVIALLQIIEKHHRIRGLLIALGILIVLFILVFFGIKLYYKLI
jgi:hypothetical protein